MHCKWLIIDGYNLMFQDNALGAARSISLENCRDLLLEKVAGTGPLLADRVTVVFDGKASGRHAESGSGSGIEVLYSPRCHTADTIIERIAHSAVQPATVCVVTSDRLQQLTVMAAGAQTMSCAEFLSHLQDNKARSASRMKQQHLLPRGPRLGDFFPE